MSNQAYTQANRFMHVATPLGPDVLLLASLTGAEGISELFHFQLDLLAENQQEVAFDKLLGQPITVTMMMPDGKKRFFNGICNRFSQGHRDDTFTNYRMEIVPELWLLTRRIQCRIFQHMSVPDILKKVFDGLNVKYEIQGTFHPRDYCVQYRESDFAFASRIMEEEGIYYYFAHSDGSHQLIVANTPDSHRDVPEVNKVIYEELRGGSRPDMRVHGWEKTQELRSGKFTLWDHCFEMPQKRFEAERAIQESITVGKVTHKLKVGGNHSLEIYDYPGRYAQRFDGIDPGGGPRPAELQKIFDDSQRTTRIRMEQEALPSLVIRGEGNCKQFTSGYKFTLERHFNADGQYILTNVAHTASLDGNYRTGGASGLVYENTFTCIPQGLPFRPPQKTARSVIQGPQTATVVGPPGEEISCDKYGRIKVQFHWDRQGKKNLDSSCWVRVSQGWGGARWGGMFIPHVGQEVIVEFEEGDPDRPLIVGRVYNAEAMPPLSLPGHKTKSIIRDHGGNQIFMDGAKGKESICITSSCGGTGISMGFSPPSIAPIGAGREEFEKLLEAANKPKPDETAVPPLSAEVQQLKNEADKLNPGPEGSPNPSDYFPSGASAKSVLNLFSSDQFRSHIRGDYTSVNEKNTQSMYLGVTKSTYVSDVYTECWTNNDTVVHGNYTCRVHGYQEYFTKGHYVTKVLGANWVHILGADTDLYFSAQQILNTGSQFELQLSKKLFKTPDEGSTYVRLREACTDVKKDVVRIAEKYGIKKMKSNMTEDETKEYNAKHAKYKGAIDSLIWTGGKATYDFSGKWLGKAGNFIWDGATQLKKKWKSPNAKDKGP